jgi:hypothetical protein
MKKRDVVNGFKGIGYAALFVSVISMMGRFATFSVILIAAVIAFGGGVLWFGDSGNRR